jgi:hypothetical protein
MKSLQLVEYPLLHTTAYHCSKCMSVISDKMYRTSPAGKHYLLELFSGSGTVSAIAHKEFSVRTCTLDSSVKCKANITADIMNVSINTIPASKKITLIWASVPCTTFSIESIHLHWQKYHITHRNYLYLPLSSEAIEAIRILDKTLWLIKQIKPKYWFIENPRGALRHTPQMYYAPFRYTVSYNDYGHNVYKPTDIFTNCGALSLKKLTTSVGKTFAGSVINMNNAAARSVVPADLIRSILSQVCR